MTGASGRRGPVVGDRWWTLAAPGYDPCVGLVGWHRWQDALVADITTGSVLDLGCGPAHLARRLLARGVDYTGLDRNQAMLARASRRLGTWGPGRTRLVLGDVAALPFAPGSFDVVVATGVLGLLGRTARAQALREIVRVARGPVRLLEPVRRPGAPPSTARSRVLAFAADPPFTTAELTGAGLHGEFRGPALLAGVYSAVWASR